MKKMSSANLKSRAKGIKLILLDVDGVLTDGRIVLDSRGNELKFFHVRDGHGIKLAQNAGIHIGIITGRNSEVVNIRARELGITEVHQGAYDKEEIYVSILKKYGLRHEEVAFIGDDIVDVPILKRVGIAVGVKDADRSIMPFVHMVTKAGGGRGAVREFIDFVLECKGMLGNK